MYLVCCKNHHVAHDYVPSVPATPVAFVLAYMQVDYLIFS